MQQETQAERGGEPGRKRRRLVPVVPLLLALLCASVAVYQSSFKSLPAGLSIEGEAHSLERGDVQFLCDLSYSKAGQRVVEQVIFDRVLGLIGGAQDFILIDCFLFNDYLGKGGRAHRQLSGDLVRALIEKKQACPGIRIFVLTDPINEAYGGSTPAAFRDLRSAGIPVWLTDLDELRDSNPAYSAVWRIFVQWFGTSPGGVFPHPLAEDAPGVGLRSWLALLNFKANHRKVVIADTPASHGGREMAALVMSANPHDASSAHSNVALLVRGAVWRDLIRSEQAVLAFSAGGTNACASLPPYAQPEATRRSGSTRPSDLTARVLTEEKIRKGLLTEIGQAQQGDSIDLAMFYLADRKVIESLVAAAGRGVAVRLLLDPNRDAFGYRKNGIPNRPVAAELVERGRGRIEVRWYATHGEQFHTKLVLLRRGTGSVLMAGSANLTSRNLGDLNLETDLVLSGDATSPPLAAAQRYFQRLWTNQDGELSLLYAAYAENSRLKYWAYRFLESSGMSTF